ncbi:MAG: hypothetical protein ACPG21_09245 [Crocinitomicaceae bacterium]
MHTIRKYLTEISNQQLRIWIISIETFWVLIVSLFFLLDKTQFVNFLIVVLLFHLLTLLGVRNTIRKNKREDTLLDDQPNGILYSRRDRWQQVTIGYYILTNIILMIVFVIVVFILKEKMIWVV